MTTTEITAEKKKLIDNLDIKLILSKGSGKPIIRLIDLDKIVENSYTHEPKCNCRNLRNSHIDELKKVVDRTGVFDAIFVMKNRTTGLYVAADGNHLQHVSRMLGETTISAYIMKGDCSREKDAWKMFCFSYVINKSSMIAMERVLAVNYGVLKYGNNYREQLSYDFVESRRSLTKYANLYNRLDMLDQYEMDYLIDYFIKNETGADKMSKKINDCLELKRNKEDGRNQNTSRGDILDKTVYKSIKKVTSKIIVFPTVFDSELIKKEIVNIQGLVEEQKSVGNIKDMSFLKKVNNDLSYDIKTTFLHLEKWDIYVKSIADYANVVKEYIKEAGGQSKEEFNSPQKDELKKS